jgi:hypothetical protein
MTDPTPDRQETEAQAEDPRGEEGASTERLQREFRRTREDTEAVVEDLRVLRGEIEGLLRQQLRARPYLTLGASAGLGYVLGGGLPKGAPALAFGMATRMAAGWLMREVAGAALAQSDGPPEEEW